MELFQIVKEYKGQGNNQFYNKALHIIDAMMLGGVDISQYALSERFVPPKIESKDLPRVKIINKVNEVDGAT